MFNMFKRKNEFAPPTDERFKETFFLVEASSFERNCLWMEWNNRVKWEQTSWCMGQIGTISRQPVTLSVLWVRIDGKLIGFWEPTSQVVDHKMIREWFAKNCVSPKWDNGTRHGRCNADNFYLCMRAIQEANKRESAVTAA